MKGDQVAQGDFQPSEPEPGWVPGRLKLARELRGLTRAELAVALNKSAAAVGQYEAALIQPQRRAWRALATALSLPPAFFRLPNAPVLPNAFFRPDRAVPQVAYRRSAAIAGLLTELHSYLQPADSDEKADIPRVRLSVGKTAEFELVAEGIRVAWDLGNHPIDDLTALLEQHHIVVASINDKPAPTGSFSTWIGNTPWLFAAASAGKPSQARFDAAHELGHLICTRPRTSAQPTPNGKRTASPSRSSCPAAASSSRRPASSILRWLN